LFLICVIAGASAIQVFDSWAGELAPSEFFTFAFPYLEMIVNQVKGGFPHIPCIVFAKGAHYALEELGKSKYDVIGLDWTIDPKIAREKCPGKVLQGNLDPCVLYGEDEVIEKKVEEMISGFFANGKNRYVCNLGHGLHPTHTPEKVGKFIEAVKKYSSK